MLRVVAHKSVAAAKAYYAEGLKREDYYSEKQEVIGQWYGLAAERLGLTGKVNSEAFAALAENIHPATGKNLTPRTRADRRVGYDLNFHAPKSLSVLHALTGDNRIVDAFRSVVAETMSEIEVRAATRVQRRGEHSERLTGNLAWAEFVHFTARPVGGIPDPHLHVHCFAFNSTFDPVEKRWKAASWAGIKKEAPYSEAVFHSRLTDKITSLGYGIQRTRQGWEIGGIPQSVITKFSRRTAQIERLADTKGITDAKAKDALGATSREGKRKGLTRSALLKVWEGRLTAEEKAAITRVRFGQTTGQQTSKITAKEALDYACEKLFAKHSVVESTRLMGEAMRYGVGQVMPTEIRAGFSLHGMVEREIKGERLCTSLDVLAEEVSLINFVRTGRGVCAPFKQRHAKFTDERLTGEQRAAVRHILYSKDQVIAVRGVAGAGKTTLMQEVVPAIEATGRRVFAFAPSAEASRGTLRESGFANAQTVAHLLANPELQQKVRGQAIWIDEAGLLGVRDMWRIMRAVGSSTRIILTGDAQQHAPVARGNPFRLLQTHAGMKVAEVAEIRRQEREAYRSAVAALSKGDLPSAFRRLDGLDAIVEVQDDVERYRLLAHDFLQLSRQGSVPLVVSPTHAESAKVTAAIRDARREAGQLRGDRNFVQYHNLQWEEADRKRPELYGEGLAVQFHQNAKGIKRGELFRVLRQDETRAVQIENQAGRRVSLPLEHAARFQVYEEREITLAVGDQIRITRNGETADGRRIDNGYGFSVAGFNRKGQIVLNTKAVLNPHHGHLAYGYCSTSHASQSKSVRDVLIAQSESSFGASSTKEQFYVSVSRGKETVRIYTDSRSGLQEAVGNTAIRLSGVELAGLREAEIASFVGMEMNAKQWRESIQSRRAEGESKTFVKNLLQERRQDAAAQKQNGTDWRQYVEARRNNHTADGKSRSKGYSGNQEKKPGYTETNKRSFIRPTSPPTEAKPSKVAERAKPAEQTQTPATGRVARLANTFRAATDHFKQAISRSKGEQGHQPQNDNHRRVKLGKDQSISLQGGDADRSAKHAAKQRTADASKQQTQQKAKVQTPTPIAVRRR